MRSGLAAKSAILWSAVLFAAVQPANAQNRPRIGYVYPAGGKHGETFREIVNRDGQGGENAHADQSGLPVGSSEGEVFNAVRFVGILVGRNQSVDQGHEAHPAEKRQRRRPSAARSAQVRRKARLPLGEDIDEGHVDHHSGGKAEGHGQETGIRSPGDEGQSAADAGRQSGDDRESKGERRVLLAHIAATLLESPMKLHDPGFRR